MRDILQLSGPVQKPQSGSKAKQLVVLLGQRRLAVKQVVKAQVGGVGQVSG